MCYGCGDTPYFQANPLKQQARINLGVLRWVHPVEPPESGATLGLAVVEPGEVSSAQEYDGSYFKTQWAPLVNILDPNIEAEGERERERQYSLLADLHHHHQFTFPRILKSLKSSGSELSSCPPMSPIPFHRLGSTGILLVDFNLRKIPIWGSNLVYINQ